MNSVTQIGQIPPLDIGCLEAILIVPMMYVFEWMLQKVILNNKLYQGMNLLLHGQSWSGKTLLTHTFGLIFQNYNYSLGQNYQQEVIKNAGLYVIEEMEELPTTKNLKEFKTLLDRNSTTKIDVKFQDGFDVGKAIPCMITSNTDIMRDIEELKDTNTWNALLNRLFFVYFPNGFTEFPQDFQWIQDTNKFQNVPTDVLEQWMASTFIYYVYKRLGPKHPIIKGLNQQVLLNMEIIMKHSFTSVLFQACNDQPIPC